MNDNKYATADVMRFADWVQGESAHRSAQRNSVPRIPSEKVSHVISISVAEQRRRQRFAYRAPIMEDSFSLARWRHSGASTRTNISNTQQHSESDMDDVTISNYISLLIQSLTLNVQEGYESPILILITQPSRRRDHIQCTSNDSTRDMRRRYLHQSK